MGRHDNQFMNLSSRASPIPTETRRLAEKFKKLLPDTPLETTFTWAGMSDETKGWLAYIGARNFPAR